MQQFLESFGIEHEVKDEFAMVVFDKQREVLALRQGDALRVDGELSGDQLAELLSEFTIQLSSAIQSIEQGLDFPVNGRRCRDNQPSAITDRSDGHRRVAAQGFPRIGNDMQFDEVFDRTVILTIRRQ